MKWRDGLMQISVVRSNKYAEQINMVIDKGMYTHLGMHPF